ncbi:MAG: hypothetical protein EA371_09985 [Gammaproteobacteria bacterium]|nr:MAG: hypothetical protein EA371_09985 [Gammaproteobacteria bacterium]
MGTYELLNWLHIVLFAYWLGADFGVFFAARLMARPGLSYDDRMRIRELLQFVDLAPRVSLILILPVGLHMAALRWGLPLGPGALSALWLASVAWLVLMLSVHARHGSALGERLRRADLGVRYLVLSVMLVLGGGSLITGSPIADGWLATKVVLFAVIIALGLALRVISAGWAPALAQLRAGENVPAAEQAILRTRRRGAVTALSLWAVLLVMAFLGTVKPFA